MATPTYVLIDSVTVGAGVSSVTFSSITQDYGDLVVASQLGGGGGLTAIKMRLNSDSTGNYDRVFIQGDGSAVSTSTNTATNRWDLQGTTFSDTSLGNSFIAQLIDYSATDKFKTGLIRYNAPLGSGTSGTTATAANYRSTLAITAIQILNTDYSFTVGSTFYLYGIES
jgi:hypothetical protein